MAAHASLWLVVCGIMMLSVGLPHASSHPTPDDNQNQEVMSYYPPAQEQQQHYYPSYDYEEEDDEKKNLQDYEPVLAESGSKDRTARKLNRYYIPRGSRFKKGNPKLFKRRQEQLDRQNALLKRLVIVKDDKDPPLELPDPSSLPWVQLATLGTFIWGMNVVFTQMILDVTDPPYVPLPFGLNRSAKDINATDSANGTVSYGTSRGGTQGLDFTEAPEIFNKDSLNRADVMKMSHFAKPLDLSSSDKEELGATVKTNLPKLSVLNRNARDVPEQLPAGETSLDFLEEYNTLEIPSEKHCREQMVCEMRHLMTYVEPLENIIRTYGMRVPGLRQGYQKALDDGSSRRSCTTPQKGNCPNSILTVLLSVAKAITGDHY